MSKFDELQNVLCFVFFFFSFYKSSKAEHRHQIFVLFPFHIEVEQKHKETCILNFLSININMMNAFCIRVH